MIFSKQPGASAVTTRHRHRVPGEQQRVIRVLRPQSLKFQVWSYRCRCSLTRWGRPATTPPCSTRTTTCCSPSRSRRKTRLLVYLISIEKARCIYSLGWYLTNTDSPAVRRAAAAHSSPARVKPSQNNITHYKLQYHCWPVGTAEALCKNIIIGVFIDRSEWLYEPVRM